MPFVQQVQGLVARMYDLREQLEGNQNDTNTFRNRNALEDLANTNLRLEQYKVFMICR